VTALLLSFLAWVAIGLVLAALLQGDEGEQL
jgi:preprotein translocase subunit SecG